jgi:hypothetical protein
VIASKASSARTCVVARAKRKPTAIRNASDSFDRAVLGAGRSRIASNPAITAAKLTPSAKKHQPSPSALIPYPAITGPRLAADMDIDELIAIAVMRPSRPTSSMMNDCRVGMSTAATRPASTARTIMCDRCTAPLNTRPDRANETSIDADCVATKIVRRR